MLNNAHSTYYRWELLFSFKYPTNIIYVLQKYFHIATQQLDIIFETTSRRLFALRVI